MRARMQKLAAFVLRRAGYGFEDMLREKERSNPKFSFLFYGQPFHDLYRALSRPPLPPAVAQPFAGLLANLNGSAASTQTAGAWIAHTVASAPPVQPAAPGGQPQAAHIAVCIAVALCEHCARARPPTVGAGGAVQLWTIFVVNDALFRLRAQPNWAAQCECFQGAVRPHLQTMVRAAVSAGSGGAVGKVLQVWRDNGAFDEETLSQLVVPAAAAAQRPAQVPAVAAAAQQSFGPSAAFPVSTGIGHGLSAVAVPVGTMASCIKMAIGSGKPRWSPVDYAMLAHVPPAIEPGRLDARIAAFYRALDGGAAADPQKQHDGHRDG